MFRYIGNKTRLLPELMKTISASAPANSTVVDLMAGTGSVSVGLRKNGFRVIAADMMTYSKHHLITQLLYDKPPSFEGLRGYLVTTNKGEFGYEKVLDFLNNLPPRKSYFYKEFSPEGTPANGSPSRKYFTAENAQRIDAIRETINDWVEKKWITENEESVLKHTLIMAVNDVANISGTYGYFLSSFNKNSMVKLVLNPITFVDRGTTHNVVLQGFAEDISSKITADLCYIDPPYMKRQYAANYHILETIARGDFPVAVGKSGLRDWRDQHSKFCTKTGIRSSFEKVITSMNCPKFLISYSEDGLLSIEDLIDIFSKYGKVFYQNVEYQRFRSNNSRLTKDLNEYIINLEKE